MVEQGDILMCDDVKFPVVVVSKNTYNKSGKAIVCPLINDDGAVLSFCVTLNDSKKYAQCDDVRRLDLSKRFFSVVGRLGMADLLNVLNRVNSLFDFI